LAPGEHGFHIHEKPSCDAAEKDGKMTAAQSAGGHFDPDNTKAHKGPGGGGHKGDLPKLVVSDKGEAKAKMEVKGLTLADFQGKSLMIHEGGDNYSDAPKPLGGGGGRRRPPRRLALRVGAALRHGDAAHDPLRERLLRSRGRPRQSDADAL